jgi:hypothetical protein
VIDIKYLLDVDGGRFLPRLAYHDNRRHPTACVPLDFLRVNRVQCPASKSSNRHPVRAMGVFEGRFPQWVYLIGYNTISALLWIFIFARTALLALSTGLDDVYLYPSVRITVLLTQSLAALDILHSIMGNFETFY